MFAGALDAHNACQTAVAARAASHGSPRTFSDSGSMPQDTLKSLLASAWAGGADAKQAQQAQLAALRVQAAMLLPGSAEHGKTLPFTKGERAICDMPPQACLHQWVCLHPPVFASYVRQGNLNGVHQMVACVHATIPALHVLDDVRLEEALLYLWRGL